MVAIDSDSAPVATAIADLLAVVERHGGRFDDRLRIRSRGGELSVHIQVEGTMGAPAPRIIQLPPACLLPVEAFHLTVAGDDIVVVDHDPDLSPARQGIMQAVVEVWNLTRKIPHHRFSNPAWLQHVSPALYRRLSAGRHPPATPAPSRNDPLVDNLLDTRTLVYRLDPTSDRHTQVIMPVIDFLNHHPFAAPYLSKADGPHNHVLAVQEFCPDPQSCECYARYGIYDGYDTFLHYGFVARETPFVISIPLHLDLPPLGKLTVHAYSGRAPDQQLPKAIADLAFYLPAFTVDRAHHSAEVGYLMIPQGNAPRALRRVLAVILHAIEPRLNDAKIATIVEAIEPEILARNVEFYQDLRRDLEEYAVPPGFRSVVDGARAMADLQLEKLRRYPFFAAR